MVNDNPTVKTFNLVDRPWIPVAGENELRSLTAVFSEPAPQRLAGNAVDKIVMFRFLLSIVHASSDIPDEAAWHALTPQKIAENARNYLNVHKDCFDLYDPVRPFLQFPQLKEKADFGGKERKKDVWTLRVNYSENQSILSSWQVHRELEDDEIARLLLRMNCAALASKIDNDIVLSPSRTEKRQNAAPGTLLGTGTYGYLHSYLIGDDLWESLRFNLLTGEEIKGLGAYREGLGKPFWEEMPTGEDDSRAKSYKNSYQGRLFPVDKCVLLTDYGKKVIKTDGIPYPTGIEISDPALTVYKSEKGLEAISAHVETRPWRELEALLNYLNSKEKTSPYFLFFGTAHMERTVTQLRFWVGGVEVSPQSGGQQIRKMNDYVESEFLLPLNATLSGFINCYKKLMVSLNTYANALRDAVKNYYDAFLPQADKAKTKRHGDKPKTLANQAVTRFWERMEPQAQCIIKLAIRVSDMRDEQFRQETTPEKELWWKTVMNVYNEFCPCDTARQMTVWVEAKPKFNRKKGKNKDGK